jgi:hypothetical protein
MPVGLNWARRNQVRSLRPHLLIIHRSVFFHPVAAALGFLYPDQIKTNFTDPAKIETELKQFDHKYKILGDEELREFLNDIGSAVPHTKFIVYSRGTDTNWISSKYRTNWINELEGQHPALAGRVTPMLITREKQGSFYNPETREELMKRVREILGLPEKRAVEKPD